MCTLTSKLYWRIDRTALTYHPKYGENHGGREAIPQGIDTVIVDHQDFTRHRLYMHSGTESKHRGCEQQNASTVVHSDKKL
jgi:hypothetical protein